MHECPQLKTTPFHPAINRNSGLFGLLRSVFWQAHPATIRMLLGLASLGWALCIFTDPKLFMRNPYQMLLAVMPSGLWSAFFIIHFIGVFWRIYDTKARVMAALFINSLGCFLWFAMTICVNIQAGHMVPGSCLEIVTCIFSAWALVRTGVGKDMGTP